MEEVSFDGSLVVMVTYNIIGISKFGFPGTSTELQKLGKIANAFGAAGVQSVGGVPVPTSKLEHLKIIA